MKSFATLLLAPLFLLFSMTLSAQSTDLVAVDDSICVMPGMDTLLNVTDNDIKNPGQFNPVFLIGQSDCFGLKSNGDLYWLPGADQTACCGEHTLRYRYEICQPPNKCSATIKIIVKCPKPDCFFVNLEDYFPNNDPNGGTPPNDPGCIYACENSGAVYFVPYDTASTYSWSVTGGTFVPGGNPAEIEVAWGAAGSGSISLTITNGNGETTVLEFCVDILPAPVAAFQPSTDSLCLNSPVSFTNNSSGASMYFWDFGDGNVSGMFQPTHQYAGPGTYTVTLIATNSNYDNHGNPLCCCADTAIATVFIDSLPGPDIYCISTLCAGDSSKYWTDASNCGSYVWTVLDENGNPWPFTGQGNDTICVQWGNGPVGTITLEVTGCDSAYCDQPVSVTVPIISPSVGINGLTDVCENASATYTVPKWMSVVYNWQVTGGTILSGQGTNTVVIQWGTAPGPGVINLNYWSPFLSGLPGHAPGDCAGKAFLTVNIKPEFDVTGPVPPVVCAGTTSTFTATAVPSAAYTWTVMPAATFTGQGTNVINVTWDAGPGTFTITAVPNNPNAYCNQIVTRIVRVIETPKPTGISGPVEICPGGTGTYFGQSAQSGTGFQWTVVGGTPASFTGNPLVVTWNNSGPYQVVLQQFNLSTPSCTSDTIRLSVLPKILNGPLVITGPAACVNAVQNYAVGPAQHPSATYNWTVTAPALGSVISGQGTPNVQVQWNNTAGPATLSVRVYLCGDSLTGNLPVTLSAAPPPVITQVGILCPGVSATLNAGPGYTSYLWSNFATTQTISISAGGNYLVTVTNSNGCTSVGTYQAVPLPGPTASISTGSVTTMCYNPPNNTGTVVMNAITGVGYTFNWFRNGVSLGLPPTQSTYTHTNTQVAGTFTYWVVVTDANGCTNQSNSIVVNQVFCPTIPSCIPFTHSLSFTSANSTPNCNTVVFTVSKSSNVTVTGWSFADPGNNTNSGTLPNAIHTYTKAGCYSVTVTATVPSFIPANSTCTITRTGQVCVPLAADFSSSVSCQTVSFTDLSTFLTGSGPVSWQWSFGDSNSSSTQNPVHTYPPAGGTFTVTLTVTNAAGCQATISKIITVPPRPTPTITANPNPVCAGQPVAFTGAGPSIISWLWNFGDGSSNGAQNPSHTYLTAGTYTVSLAVVNSLGCKDTAYASVVVHPAPPVDTIAWSPALSVCAGTNVTLTAPTGTGGYTYLWSNNATTSSISVATSGTYTVQVTDANGCTYTTDSVTVTVLPLPTASISGPAFICDAGCVTLSATTGFGYTYQWLDHTNTPIGGEVNATISVCDFNLLPAYSVIVTDANGCSATSAQHTVSLATSPSFVVTTAPAPPCEGSPVTLTITSPQPDVAYSWSTGGTGTSITVLQAGTYFAVGTDTLTGCKGTASAVVYPLPDLCIVPAGCYKACDPDTICGPDGLAAYQWNLNGVPIPGETNQCLIVTQSGTYSLTGTTQNGCSSTSDSLMLMLINCDCDGLTASVEPSKEDSCCWSLSFTNNFGPLFGVQISTTDADFVFDLGSLDNSLAVFSVTTNAIGLVSSTTGSPLPTGTLASFLNFCFANVVNSPQQIVLDWYDFDFNIACSDTIVLNCPVEPDCLYLSSDSISCKGKDVVYTFTVCNPVDSDFPVAYFVLMPKAPAGVSVSPNTFDETANPIQPGECRTYTVLVSGPLVPGDLFCFALTAHDEVPGEIDTSLCCMLDTMYCIPIPDCDPCDEIGVKLVEALSEKEGKCCYDITLSNNYAAGYFDGIGLCMLSPGTTMTINNPFGSGWTTVSYSPTVIDLNVSPPLGTSLPLGAVQLPQICIQTNAAPAQLLEIKWMKGDSVECRDTIELGCEPPCGYIPEEAIVCDPATSVWVWSGTIKNTSAYTMGEAHIIFTSPAGMLIYNSVISLGTLVPGGTQPFNVTLGPPALPGDSVCFIVALHALDDDAGHTQCCNFNGCIVLPDCDPFGPNDNEHFVLFPNPSDGQVFARLTSGWNTAARFRVYDMLGREVADLNVPYAAGKFDLPLQFDGLGRGIFTVIAESGARKWVVKMVVE
ncbi:MAG: PKD domain-containing protein [Saprospiraceae bacterium]|nr:PKD domain-containing protein [Saprospiraceae bacterium]